ncbi:MAG: outer membrane lipoprotein-sorting protein [Verrucomicrobiota bacterium]
MKRSLSLLLILLALGQAGAQDAVSAPDLAAKLSTLQQDGTSLVRLKMDMKGRSSLQLQIKQRREGGSADVLYQVLWPKERAGEAVLLRKSGSQAGSAATFTPPDKTGSLEMSGGLFGSELTPSDVLENFFAWPTQAITGTEAIGRVTCQILESKPGKGQRSSYASVRTWVDTRRSVPLRIEKYNSSGQVICRIESGRIVTDVKGRHVPASFTVSRNGTSTELDGSKLKHDVSFAADEFTAEGMKKAAAAKPTEP